jgi:hypothetical protein
MRWCSRHSLQTQPCTYAALVPCARSPAGCRQDGIKRCRPLRVGLGKAPDLVGGKAKLTEHRPQRPASVDRIRELSAHVCRESLRSRPFANTGNVTVRCATGGPACSRRSTVPSCHAWPEIGDLGFVRHGPHGVARVSTAAHRAVLVGSTAQHERRHATRRPLGELK